MSLLAPRRPRPAPLGVTVAVRIAAALSFVYGLGGIALGSWLTVALATGRGLGADTHEYLVFRGVTTTIVSSFLAGAVLLIEAFLVLRGARGIGVVVVAGIVAFGGVVGEVIEAVTGGEAASLAIGVGIIVAAAAPAVLLLLPRAPRSTLSATAEPASGLTSPPQP